MDRILICLLHQDPNSVSDWFSKKGYTALVTPDRIRGIQDLMGASNHGEPFDAIFTDSTKFARLVRDTPAPVKMTPMVYRGEKSAEAAQHVNIAFPNDGSDLIKVTNAIHSVIAKHRHNHPPEAGGGPTIRRT